jgi:hypothetical protein
VFINVVSPQSKPAPHAPNSSFKPDMVWAAPDFQSRRLIFAGAAQTMRLNFALGGNRRIVA